MSHVNLIPAFAWSGEAQNMSVKIKQSVVRDSKQAPRIYFSELAESGSRSGLTRVLWRAMQTTLKESFLIPSVSLQSQEEGKGKAIPLQAWAGP